MRQGRLLTIVGGVFGLIGLGLLVLGIALAASTATFMGSAARADGTVVAMTERSSTSRDSHGRTRTSTSWYPTVRFTVEGRPYSFRSSIGTDPPAYEEGDAVPVAYDPGDPSDARIASFWSAYLAPLIVGGLGLVFTPIGTVLFVKGRRAARPRV